MESKLVIGVIVAALVSLAAWGTHIIVCLQTSKYILLIAGAIAFPVGVVHGIGVWFGVNW